MCFGQVSLGNRDQRLAEEEKFAGAILGVGRKPSPEAKTIARRYNGEVVGRKKDKKHAYQNRRRRRCIALGTE